MLCVVSKRYLPPEKQHSPLKTALPKGKVVSQPPFFIGYIVLASALAQEAFSEEALRKRAEKQLEVSVMTG